MNFLGFGYPFPGGTTIFPANLAGVLNRYVPGRVREIVVPGLRRLVVVLLVIQSVFGVTATCETTLGIDTPLDGRLGPTFFDVVAILTLVDGPAGTTEI